VAVPEVKVSVLGGVAVLRHGRRVVPRRQVGVTLAALVAARGRPVESWFLAESVQRSEGQGPKFDPLPKIMSELRDLLDGTSLDIPHGSQRGYQLVPKAGTGLEDAVDAYRFLALTETAGQLYAGGDEDAALARFEEAAVEWAGPPFDVAWQRQLPASCNQFSARLERRRRDLVRQVAEITLRRGGRYEAMAVFQDRPVGRGTEKIDVVWLVTLLMTKFRDRRGIHEAERIIAASEPGDVVRRARYLAGLCRAGVRIHEPLAAVRSKPVRGSPEHMVGRQPELEAFREMLGAVRQGRPSTMIVRGASGQGKTRLAEELAILATAEGVPVLFVSRRARGQLAPWQYLVGALWANSLKDTGAGSDPLGAGQHEVLMDFARGSSAERPGPAEDPQRQFAELADGVSMLARQAAGRRGLIVAFDDADQFADRGHELLRDVRALLADVPVGWLVVGRDAGTWADLPPLGPGEVRAGRVLRPLTRADVRQWVAQVRRRMPEGAEAEADSVYRRSRGLPVSICDELAGRPRQVPAYGTPEDDADLFEWAAAAAITATDLDIDTELVRTMLELSDEEADRRETGAAGPWRIDTKTNVRFTHGRYLAKVIKRLDESPAARRRLHVRAFQLLRERVRAADDADPGLPVRIAGHARGADRDLVPAEAARAYLAAARAEMAGYDADAAVGWARAGLRKAPVSDPVTRFGLHMVLGDALDDRGDSRGTDEQYQLAYKTAAERPHDRARAAIALARRWTDPGRVDQELLIMLRASREGMDGDDGAEAVTLRLRLTAHLASKSALAIPVQKDMPSSLLEDGITLARTALSQLTPDLPPDVVCEVLDECRWARHDYYPPAETILLSRRLEQASILARSPRFQSEALIALAMDQLRLGQVAAARATAERHRLSLARGNRASWLQGTMDTLLDMWDGDFDRAHQRLFGEAERAVGQALVEQARWADTFLQTRQGQVYWLMRERGLMRDLLDSPVADQIGRHGHFPIWRVAMILAFCDTGDLDRAARELQALARESDDFAAFPPHGWTTSAAALLAESCLALSPVGPDGPRPHPLAGRLRELLDQWPGEFVLAGWPTVLLGPVSRFSGLLATAVGDYAGAIRLFDEGLDVVGAARPQVARLRLDKARALIRLGGAQAADEAASLLTQARDEAERLGMTLVAGQASRLLQP
jgi:AAA ATPase domain/Bacterial transcriptional activator domain